MKKKLIYFSNYPVSVFPSQVVSLLNETQKANYFDTIHLVVASKKKSVTREIYNKGLSSGIQVKEIPYYPNIFFLNRLKKKHLSKALENIGYDNGTIIHTRSDSFSKLLKSIVRDKTVILTDIRGATVEEQIYYKKNTFSLLHYLKILQFKKNRRYLHQYTDYISVVSDELKKYMIKYSEVPKDKIFINHSMAGPQFKYDQRKREYTRKELNVKSDEIICVFVTGGDSAWQRTEEIIQKLETLNIKILNLSRKEVNHSNVITKFVPFGEVNRYLSAADVGIIVRDQNVVNKVASPVKFSEYVCCGLPVISNRSVDVITKYINNTRQGITILDMSEIDMKIFKGLKNYNRYKISQNAQDYFGAKKITYDYISIYKKIVNKSI